MSRKGPKHCYVSRFVVATSITEQLERHKVPADDRIPFNE